MICTDQNNHRVVRWMPNGKEGICIAGGQGPGDNLNQLNFPRGVYADTKTREMFICDTDNNRVVKWKWNAREGQVVAGGFGAGSGLHQLHGPRTLLMEPETGAMIIADLWNHRVMRWMPGAEAGEIIAGGNGTGKKINQIAWPYGLALDHDGVLYVSDHLNHRVMRWAVGAAEGEVVAGGRGPGIDPDHLHGPCGIMFDAYNRLVVADSANHRIIQFQMDGMGRFAQDGEIIAGGNDAGDKESQLSWPHNVSMNKHGELMIADFMNHRVVKWVPGQKTGVKFAGGNGLGSGLNQLS